MTRTRPEEPQEPQEPRLKRPWSVQSLPELLDPHHSRMSQNSNSPPGMYSELKDTKRKDTKLCNKLCRHADSSYGRLQGDASLLLPCFASAGSVTPRKIGTPVAANLWNWGLTWFSHIYGHIDGIFIGLWEPFGNHSHSHGPRLSNPQRLLDGLAEPRQHQIPGGLAWGKIPQRGASVGSHRFAHYFFWIQFECILCAFYVHSMCILCAFYVEILCRNSMLWDI